MGNEKFSANRNKLIMEPAQLTLKETIDLAKKDPVFADNLAKDMRTGMFDEIARSEGIDISEFSPSFSQEFVDTESNIGTGFTPKVEATGQESLIQGVGKAARNTPRSAVQFAKDIVSSVTRPAETIKGLKNIVGGVGAKAGEALIKTDLLQEMYKKYEEQTGQTLPRDEEGKIKATETPELQTINAVGSYLENRYGGAENIAITVQEDPVGFASDIAGLISGGATLASKSPRLAGVATRAQAVSRTIEPTRALSSIGKRAIKPFQKAATAVGEGLERFKPSEVRSRAIVNNLGITRGELVNINELVRRTDPEADVSKFVDRNKIDVSVNTEWEKVAELESLAIEKAVQKKEILGKINTLYERESSPIVSRVNQIGKALMQNLEGVGNEADFAKAQRYATQEHSSLLGLDEAKQFMSQKLGATMFKAGGQPKGGLTQEGLRNVYGELREFIEKESGQPDLVKELNNDVAVSKALANRVKPRIGAEKTNKLFGLSDQGTAVGLSAAVLTGTIDFGTGVGLFAAKKILESPTFQLYIADGFSKIPTKEVSDIIKSMTSDNLSPKDKARVQKIVDEAYEKSIMAVPALRSIDTPQESESQ